jgi:hypothetical protein
MSDASVRRRGHGDDAIYFAADKNQYIGAVSLDFGQDGRRLRRKVSGKTKQEVRDKLKAIYAELNVGLQSSAGYTVRTAVDDWLEHGLSGRSTRTVQLYRDGVRPLTDRLGARPLRKLSAADVRSALAVLSEQLSTRSLQIAHNCLVRAIRHAESNDLVGRNVAALVRPPAGHEGRPSKALSVDQAQELLRAAADEGPDGSPHRLHAYVVLLLTTGLRPGARRPVRRGRRSGGPERRALVRPPAGHEYRPSKALSVERAQQLPCAAAMSVRAVPASVACLRGPSVLREGLRSRRSPGSLAISRPARPRWAC